MRVLKATFDNIKKAAHIIKQGGIVVFPTETVYGLGADAFNPQAVAKIFEVKERPRFDPLIVHINSLKWLDILCSNVNDIVLNLARKFWPGPLTLVLPKKRGVPDIVTAGLSTVAIRMPDSKVALSLIEEAGTPIAAPSANKFGRLSSTCVEHVIKQFSSGIDIILDGGRCKIGVESTIVEVEENKIRVLRCGGLSLEEIAKVVNMSFVEIDTGIDEKLKSPGRLARHYAPSTKLVIVKDFNFKPEAGRVGVLLFKLREIPFSTVHVEILSKNGNLVEAAARLFESLHRLDEMGLDIIYAEAVPEVGLGRAIMERLYKASREG